MAKLRYDQNFKSGMAVLILCILLFGGVIVFGVVARVQYAELTAGMLPTEAVVLDVDLDVHVKGPDEQELYIRYEVEGRVYERELKTDTAVSFSPGVGASYREGDGIEILYDPADPTVIATPRSLWVGNFYMAVGGIGLGLILLSLILVLKKRRQYLVTREDYEKEKLAAKQRRLNEKEWKAEARAKRWRPKTAPWLTRVILWALLALLLILLRLFIGFLLFGSFLIALGY